MSSIDVPAESGISEPKKISWHRHWWRKTFAGGVLGLTLALALSGLFAWLGPGGLHAADKAQFVMWLIAPLWLVMFSLVYLISHGNRAIILFAAANLFAWLALLFVRGVI